MSAPLKENKQTNKKATVLPKTDYFKCKVEIVEFIQFFCIISWRGALFPRVFSWCTEVQTTAKVRTEMEWTLPLSVLDIGGPSFPSSLQRTPILSDRLDSMKPQHDWHKRDRPGLNRRAPLLIFSKRLTSKPQISLVSSRSSFCLWLWGAYVRDLVVKGLSHPPAIRYQSFCSRRCWSLLCGLWKCSDEKQSMWMGVWLTTFINVWLHVPEKRHLPVSALDEKVQWPLLCPASAPFPTPGSAYWPP